MSYDIQAEHHTFTPEEWKAIKATTARCAVCRRTGQHLQQLLSSGPASRPVCVESEQCLAFLRAARELAAATGDTERALDHLAAVAEAYTTTEAKE